MSQKTTRGSTLDDSQKGKGNGKGTVAVKQGASWKRGGGTDAVAVQLGKTSTILRGGPLRDAVRGKDRCNCSVVGYDVKKWTSQQCQMEGRVDAAAA